MIGTNDRRSRRRGQRVALVALTACLAFGCRGGETGPSPRARPRAAADFARMAMEYRDYNLVFVSFDALQAAHVGCLGYGRDVTPNLDRLADGAFRFPRAYSVASWTVPASMTWFTGVYPSEHGMTNKFAVYRPPETRVARLDEVAPGLLTLAEILGRRGYATGGFTGNAGVSAGFGYDRGFDVYDHEPGTFGRMDRSIPEALDWVRANRDRKFFLFLHGYDAHGQSTPEGGFDYRFVDPGYDRRYTGSGREQEALREEGLAKGRLSLRDADVRFWRAIYDEKIQRLDARFGEFLAAYERLGLMKKTLFVLTSDHGTEFHEHGRLDHGFTLYDEQLRVPLFIKLPGQAAPAVIDERVSSVDILPTILDLLDVPRSDETAGMLRGTSLVPALKGEPVGRDVFSETDYREYTFKRSIITPEGWKLIYTLEAGTRELYHLDRDPGESSDMSSAEPARADELERRLFAHFRAIGHDLEARSWEVGLNPVYPSQARDGPGP